MIGEWEGERGVFMPLRAGLYAIMDSRMIGQRRRLGHVSRLCGADEASLSPRLTGIAYSPILTKLAIT